MYARATRVLFRLSLPLSAGCTAMGALQTADAVGEGRGCWRARLMAQG